MVTALARSTPLATMQETELGPLPEDWKTERLGNITLKVGSGITPTGGSRVYQTSGRPFVRSQNVGWGVLLLDDLAHISDEIHQTFPDTELRDGDVLLNITGASIGRCAVADRFLAGGNVNQHVCIVRVDHRHHNSQFLASVLLSRLGQHQIDSFQAGGNREGLNFGQVRSIVIPVPPSKIEQEAIAEALSDADALIESLETLIAKKRAIKQGAMQDLLSGRKRLPGFSGEWKTTAIGECLTIMHGKSQHEVAVQDGPYPILATGGQIGTACRFLYDKPSVLIGRKGTIDRPQYCETPFWTVDTLFYSVMKEQHVAQFFFYRFELIDWYAHNEASGVPSLNARTIEKIELPLPEPDEQAAIAALLTEFDAELSALNHRLTKARQIKQGMMQELLTGRVRLL